MIIKTLWLLLILPSVALAQVATSGTDLILQTGGTERARLTTAGNLGIGTTSPAQRLTVSGTIESTSGGFMFPDGTTQPAPALRMIGYAQRNDTGVVTINGTIPMDNTIPQVSEGGELISVTVVVSAAASNLYFMVQGPHWSETSNHSDGITLALFRDGQAGTDALAAFGHEGDYANNAGYASTVWRIASPGAGTHTFRVRMGGYGGPSYINRAYNMPMGYENTLAGGLNQVAIYVAEL